MPVFGAGMFVSGTAEQALGEAHLAGTLALVLGLAQGKTFQRETNMKNPSKQKKKKGKKIKETIFSYFHHQEP